MLCKVKCIGQQNSFVLFHSEKLSATQGTKFYFSTMQEITFFFCGFVSYKVLILFALDRNEIFFPHSALRISDWLSIIYNFHIHRSTVKSVLVNLFTKVEINKIEMQRVQKRTDN